MNIDRELFDEENSYLQNQDKWENFGTQNVIIFYSLETKNGILEFCFSTRTTN